MNRLLACLVASLFIGACSFTRDTPAPVVNVTAPAASVNPAAIAKPQLAPAPAATTQAPAAKTTINRINQDDDGEVVQSTTKPAATAAKPVGSGTSVAAAGGLTTIGGVQWMRPTDGTIVQPYSPAAKGVDVAGKEGQAIIAAAAGKVVYSGSGLKGYGNLIIIKHQDNFLTAYSHNKLNLVKEGDLVKQGQKIAQLGKTDSDKPILHFELRKNGKPQNPTSIFDN